MTIKSGRIFCEFLLINSRPVADLTDELAESLIFENIKNRPRVSIFNIIYFFNVAIYTVIRIYLILHGYKYSIYVYYILYIAIHVAI